jgi:spore maturation protein CgeB
MTHSRFGVRQLPINTINDNGVEVIVDALPLNEGNKTIDGPYDYAHDDEPTLIREINKATVHTKLGKHLWKEYMNGWIDKGVDLLHLPVAGNIVKAMPPSCSLMTDVAMVANFTNRQGVMNHLIEPLFNRLSLLGYSYQAFGDDAWQLAGLNYNGPLLGDTNKLAHVYGTAKVCPNVHTERQISLQSHINERSFMIPLCGGTQVSDNPMTTKYLGTDCVVATSITDFIQKVIWLAGSSENRNEMVRNLSEHVANNHTYFNRLSHLFDIMGLHGLSDEVDIKGQAFAVKHGWELNARLSAAERGVSYETKTFGSA